MYGWLIFDFKFLLKLFFFTLCILPGVSFADHKNPTLKIAIIDNFHSQKLSSEEYATYYLNGVGLAIHQARNDHISVQYKTFTYGSGPLDILQIVSSVKNWQPDLIIGPRASNLFLLLNGEFSHVMVLSPFATANMVNTLPKNFYSLTPPDNCAANAIALTIKKMFPKTNIITLVQADCKSCMDISQKFNQELALISPETKIYTYPMVMDHVKTMDIRSELINFKPGDVIFLPDPSYQTAILMPRITNELKQPTVFIGDDDWGDWNDAMVGKIKAQYPYLGYRVEAWSIYDKSKKVINFKQKYLQKYKTQPDSISYISYTTVLSAIRAIQQYPEFCGDAINAVCVLKTYQHALQKDPTWFRSKNYFIHKVDLAGESYVGKIDRIHEVSRCWK